MNEAAESELEERGVSTARVMVVEARATGTEGNDALMQTAKARAQDPAIFEEFPPLFLGGEISSTRWDAYDTSMSPDTLQNFARGASDGVAILLNHATYMAPIGHSLAGRFVGGGGNGVARTEADFFVFAADPETEATARKIRAGVLRDISVGFYGGVYRCTICKKDMMRWSFGMRDSCPHMLGVHYTPRDEAGVEKGEPQKARAVIEGASLAEFSVCYDGATPGAMLKKARAMATEGLLSDQERQLVQQRYHTALPDRKRIFPASTTRKATTTMNEPTLEEGGVRLSDGRLLTPVDVQNVDTAAREARAVRTALDEAKFAKANEPVEAIRALAGELTALRSLEAEVGKSREGDEASVATASRLRALADDGRTYRADLIESALTEGVRAMGNDFPKEEERADLASAPIATIKRRLNQWKATADKALPGGRITQDEEGKRQAPAIHALPTTAYRA